uniref:BZIP domain-containing protein n=1 Tax=Peronospora matthiolae TaxID=2874970 RepID=A0AAV1THA6_9STRA
METAAHDRGSAESEDEMPLLFMDELPSNFQQNAQLAAIATFMDSSDDEAWETTSGYKKARRRVVPRNSDRGRQKPYANRKRNGKKTESQRNEKKGERAADTKELQLFLSMSHVT